MTTRKIEIGRTLATGLVGIIEPREIFISRGKRSERLYAAEEARTEAINSCADAWAAYSGLDVKDRTVFWSHVMPQALFDALESYAPAAAVPAAEAFLKQFGWTIERPGVNLPQDDHLGEGIHEVICSLADDIEKLYHRAGRQFDLPHEPATYAANQPAGERWSCPYQPNEIAEFVRSKIDEVTATIKVMAGTLTPPAANEDPAELWEEYLAQLEGGKPSPQGAMAFAFAKLTTPAG